MQIHQYKLALKWTGNKGEGTIDYRSFERSHEIKVPDKPTLLASAESAFRGEYAGQKGLQMVNINY